MSDHHQEFSSWTLVLLPLPTVLFSHGLPEFGACSTESKASNESSERETRSSMTIKTQQNSKLQLSVLNPFGLWA